MKSVRSQSSANLMRRILLENNADLSQEPAEESAYPTTLCVRETNLLGTPPDMDACGDHEASRGTGFGGGAAPGSMRGTCSPVRDVWPNHNLLICSPSAERGGIFSGEALPSRRLGAGPASHTIECPPRSTGFKFQIRQTRGRCPLSSAGGQGWGKKRMA